MTKKKSRDEMQEPVVEAEYICQHCGESSPIKEWKGDGDICPKCGKKYDPQLEE